MRNFENANAEELAEVKLWLFQENVRLETGKQDLKDQMRKLEYEKRSLEQEKKLFERKWKVLESGFRSLQGDKEEIELEKRRLLIEKEKLRCRNTTCQYGTSGNNLLFFRGINSAKDLKKRYKDLVKIFHPDNPLGDRDTILTINREYDSLRMYLE